MPLVLGIDGGGTHTRAWLAQMDGRVLGAGRVGGSNAYQLGPEASGVVIIEAATTAWRDAGLPDQRPGELAAVFAGVAGAGGRLDQLALAALLAERLSIGTTRCQVDHDLRVAHAGALAGAPGAVLVAGTGSACYGRTSDRRTATAGGWGALLDDGGSGYWLGLQGMRAVIRAADGRGEATALSEALLREMGVATPRAMLESLRRSGMAAPAPTDIARLAPVVVSAASGGDQVALGIVNAGARELAAMVGAVAGRLGFGLQPDARVAGSGGILETQPFYFEKTREAIAEVLPLARFQRALLPAVAGAVLLAIETAGHSAGPDVIARLLEQKV